MTSLSKIVAGAVLTLTLGIAGISSAQAGGFGVNVGYKNFNVGYNNFKYVPQIHVPHCHYKWVTVWETRTIAETIYVTSYDYYGRPISVPKTVWKTISVPVTRQVKVCH